MFEHGYFDVMVEHDTGTIREYGARVLSLDEPPMPTAVGGSLDPQQMEAVAREIAEEVGGIGEAELASLDFRASDPDGKWIFFRWEDTRATRGADVWMTPFLQVAVTTNGDLVNLANYIR